MAEPLPLRSCPEASPGLCLTLSGSIRSPAWPPLLSTQDAQAPCRYLPWPRALPRSPSPPSPTCPVAKRRLADRRVFCSGRVSAWICHLSKDQAGVWTGASPLPSLPRARQLSTCQSVPGPFPHHNHLLPKPLPATAHPSLFNDMTVKGLKPSGWKLRIKRTLRTPQGRVLPLRLL